VERVRVAAVRGRVGEQSHQVESSARTTTASRVGARPARGLAACLSGAGSCDVGDRRLALRERVQPLLLRAPVEALERVADQLAQVLEVGAQLPSAGFGLVGPARAAQPVGEVVDRADRSAPCSSASRARTRTGAPGSGGREHGVGDGDPERLDRHPRNIRKNPRTCLTSDSGCSSAAKWPPCGSSSNQRRSVNRCAASRREGRVMSRG
jgi:hypothetical protein